MTTPAMTKPEDLSEQARQQLKVHILGEPAREVTWHRIQWWM